MRHLYEPDEVGFLSAMEVDDAADDLAKIVASRDQKEPWASDASSAPSDGSPAIDQKPRVPREPNLKNTGLSWTASEASDLDRQLAQ